MNNLETLPFDNELEKTVLGCMLIDENAAITAKGLLSVDDFYVYANKTTFQAICEILNERAVPDVVSLKTRLEAKGEYERCGGFEYIKFISSVVGSSVNLKHYSEELHRLAYRRWCIEISKEMNKIAYSGDVEALQKLMMQSDKNGGIRTETLETASDSCGNFLEKLYQRRKDGEMFSGLATGFCDLDFYLGGLQKDYLIIVAGRPSMGKTAFALDLLRNCTQELKENEISVFFSLEMSKDQVSARIISAESKVESSIFSIRQSSEEEWEKAMNKISLHAKEFDRRNNRIYIDDTAGIALEQIYAKCYNLQAHTGKKIGLVVVDYLQIMGGKRTSNRSQDIGDNSMGLKNLSKDFHCPVVALSQLSRDCEKRPDKRPVLSDLRESGSIEQDADVVMFMYRDKYYFPDTEKGNAAEVIIAKHRNGPTGTVELAFLDEYTTFANLAKGW